MSSPAPGGLDATGGRSLDPRVVRLWRLSGAMRTLIMGAIVAATEFWLLEGALPAGALTGTALVLGALWTMVGPGMRYRRWRFAVRAEDVILRRGIAWRTVTIVPHVRVQHVDTRHGPLERWLGLGRVVIHTAASGEGAIEIPGLDAAEADELRDRLAALSGTDDAI